MLDTVGALLIQHSLYFKYASVSSVLGHHSYNPPNYATLHGSSNRLFYAFHG